MSVNTFSVKENKIQNLKAFFNIDVVEASDVEVTFEKSEGGKSLIFANSGHTVAIPFGLVSEQIEGLDLWTKYVISYQVAGLSLTKTLVLRKQPSVLAIGKLLFTLISTACVKATKARGTISAKAKAEKEILKQNTSIKEIVANERKQLEELRKSLRKPATAPSEDLGVVEESEDVLVESDDSI